MNRSRSEVVRRHLFILVLMAGTAVPLIAQSTRTWVASYGLDSNPCSRTSPCRTFNVAIGAVATGGEVVVIDSAGYGPATVNKAVALIAPAGVHAAIAPTSGTAITISGAGGPVTIRGLYLNSVGASDGIYVYTGPEVHVESCVIAGFTSHGLIADVSSPASVTVLDTVFRDNLSQFGNSAAAMFQAVSSTIHGFVDHCRFSRNDYGLVASDNSNVTVRDSIAVNGVFGFVTQAYYQANSAVLSAEDCVLSGHSIYAFAALAYGTGTVRMSIANSAALESAGGIVAAPNKTIRVGGTTVSGNQTGIDPGGGTIISFGTNRVDGNTTNGAFTSTVPVS